MGGGGGTPAGAFDGRGDGQTRAVMVLLMSLGAVELIRADFYQIGRCLNTGRYGDSDGKFGRSRRSAVRVLKASFEM